MQGLCNINKRRAIFSYLKTQKATIFCLQETYSSSSEDEKVQSAEWGSKIYIFLHGSSHSRGLCILLNPSNVALRLQSVKQDSELHVRYLIAKATLHNKSFFVVNIYAPMDSKTTLSIHQVSSLCQTQTPQMLSLEVTGIQPSIQLISAAANPGT